MKKMIRLKNLLFLAVLLIGISSCDNNNDDNQEQPLTIVETAQDTDALNSLVAALAKADENDDSDLIGALSGQGPFTVFAPTNDAFTSLLGSLDGFDSLDDFDTPEERALLATILKYHVIAGVAAKAEDLSDGQELSTLQSEILTVRLDGGVFIDDATDVNAEVVIPDVEASNGIVHVINKVLVPQAVIDALNGNDPGTLVDIVVATEALSILEAAVIKADLAGTLSSEGPFTVFAPTNDAFVALLDILGDDYNSLDDFDTDAEIALLKNILLYHVIPARVLEADLAPGMVGTALMDNSIEIIASGNTFVIGDASDVDATITGTDIVASNGVAHTINKVLLPQEVLDFLNPPAPNIVQVAQSRDDLTILVDALVKVDADASLIAALSGTGPFTVFAPNNEAFVSLLDDLGPDFNSLEDFDTQGEIDLLITILKYHVAANLNLNAADFVDGELITTLQGETLKQLKGPVPGGTRTAIDDKSSNHANLRAVNLEASNGIIHVVSKVLLPQEVLDALPQLD